MSRARDLADLIDASGSVKTARLSNVPASNDASALTTGTLDGARLPDPLPSIDGSNLTGIVSFASGTKMLFGQTAAPTGWTKITTDDDAALRIVSGTVGSGGSSGLSTALATPTVTGTIAGSTGAHTLSTSQMPSHTHNSITSANNGGSDSGVSGRSSGASATGYVTGSTGGNGSHSHSLSATFSGGTAAINVKYVDVIMASKD